MPNYKCLRGWQRHSAGTIINEWEFNKLPVNIKGNFEEIRDKVHVQVKERVVQAEPQPEPTPIEPIKPNPFKPKSKVETENDFRHTERSDVQQGKVD